MNEKKSLPGVRYTVIGVLLVITLIMLGFMNRLSSSRILNEQELSENGAYLLPMPRKFSDFQLTDHNSQPFTQKHLQGKWTLVFFGFTHCPDICPTTMAALAKMYKELKPEEQQSLQVMLVSLDPERDTPEKLAQYVPYFHQDFIGATAGQYVLLKLATELNVAYSKVALGKDDSYTIDHSGNVILINPYGHFHGYFRPPFEYGSMRVALRSIQETFNE